MVGSNITALADRMVCSSDMLGVGDGAMLGKGAAMTSHHFTGQGDHHLGGIDPDLDPPPYGPGDGPNSHRSLLAPKDPGVAAC